MLNRVYATGLISRQLKVGTCTETLYNAIHQRPLCLGPALRMIHPQIQTVGRNNKKALMGPRESTEEDNYSLRSLHLDLCHEPRPLQ